MAQNRTMAIKHSKARQMASKERIERALDESILDIMAGRLTFIPDSLSMGKPVRQKKRTKVKAGHGYRKVSPVLLDFYRKEFEKYE